MGAQLSAIARTTPGEAADRLLVYGSNGSGKTTWAASAEKGLFLPTEDGFGVLEVDALPIATDFDEVMSSLREIASEKHGYGSLIIDTLDGLETMIHAHVCDREGKPALSKFAHGSGYLMVDQEWIKFLRALDFLRSQGLHIITLAHEAVTYVEDPALGSFRQYSPNLHRRALPFVTAWADAVMWLHREEAIVERGDEDHNRTVRTAMSTGVRLLETEAGGSFVAKNRWALRPQIEVPFENGFAAFRNAKDEALAKAKERSK